MDKTIQELTLAINSLSLEEGRTVDQNEICMMVQKLGIHSVEMDDLTNKFNALTIKDSGIEYGFNNGTTLFIPFIVNMCGLANKQMYEPFIPLYGETF